MNIHDRTVEEAWMLARSIQVAPAGHPLPEHRNGVVTARTHPTGWFISARYAPALTADDIEDFKQFVAIRVYLLLTDGPREAVWSPVGEQGWDAYCTDDRVDLTGLIPDTVPSHW